MYAIIYVEAKKLQKVGYVLIETVTFDFRNKKISYTENGKYCVCKDARITEHYEDVLRLSGVEDLSCNDVFSAFDAMVREGEAI